MMPPIPMPKATVAALSVPTEWVTSGHQSPKRAVKTSNARPGAAGTTIAGSIAYLVPKAATTHFITELPANSGYSVAAAASGSNHNITVTPGGSLTTSAKGVLTFTVSAAGVVGPGDRIFADGFGG